MSYQALAGLDARPMFSNRWRSLITQTPPSLDEDGPVRRDIGEMPIETTLGDAELFAEPVDPQRIRPAVGEECESGLDPVVDRQPAGGTARRGHARQHTVMTSRLLDAEN